MRNQELTALAYGGRMHAASSRGRNRLKVVASPAREAPAEPRLSVAEEVIERARQDYLDALPIAAAVICISAGGDPYIDMANENFRQLTDWNRSEEHTSALQSLM